MPLQQIENNESGLSVRNKINGMFSEIYSSIIQPVKLPDIAGNTQYVIPGNTFLSRISFFQKVGTPTVRIGTTPNGEELMPSTDYSAIVNVDQYFAADTTIYITLAGGGQINIRLDVINNYY